MYSAKENYRLISEFNSSYWGGLDCKVYLNDIQLPDSTQINYQELEVVRPYWHYSSYTPSTIRHGTRIYQGELTINYTRASYMYAILDRIRNSGLITEGKKPNNNNQADGTQTNSPVLYSLYPDGEQTSRKIMEENLTADQRREFVLARKKMSNNTSRSKIVNPLNSVIPSTSSIFDSGDRLELSILYGASLARAKTLKFRATENDYYADGHTVESDIPNPAALGTGIKLLRVHLVSKAISTNDDGRPIMETFSFVAANSRILNTSEISEYEDTSPLAERALTNDVGQTQTVTQN